MVFGGAVGSMVPRDRPSSPGAVPSPGATRFYGKRRPRATQQSPGTRRAYGSAHEDAFRQGIIGGHLHRPVAPAFELPAPTFPGMNAQPELGAMTDIANQLYQQGLSGIDTARGDIKADLARQLDLLRQQGLQQRADVRRNIGEIGRQTREGEESTEAGLAARGLGGGGVVEGKVEDVTEAGERAVREQEIARRRGAQGRAAERERLKVQAERDLRQLDETRKRMQLERKLDEQQAKVESRQFSTSQATGWTNARFRELVNAGLPESAAHATAVAEARQYFTGVPDTYIRGFRQAPTEERRDPIQARYRVPGGLGLERAQKLAPAKRREIEGLMRNVEHPVGRMAGIAERYASAGGNDPEEFLRYLEDSFRIAGANEAEVRQIYSRYANALSYMMTRFY